MRIRFVNSIYTLHTLSLTRVNTCTYTHTYTCYCMPLFINIKVTWKDGNSSDDLSIRPVNRFMEEEEEEEKEEEEI